MPSYLKLSVAYKLKSELAEEEARIIYLKGKIEHDSIQSITVVANESWTKRSYKNRYNSLSGVIAIVGFITKKILYIGIRNKYSSSYDRVKRAKSSFSQLPML